MEAVAGEHAPEQAQHRATGHLRVLGDAPRFSALPHEVIRDTRLSRDARLLYAVLQMHWWKTGECHAGNATLAEEMGCSDSQLRRYIGELIGAGWIAARRAGRGQAKAYAPAQQPADGGAQPLTGERLNRSPVSGLDPNRSPVAIQSVTGERLDAANRSPVTDSYKKTPEKKTPEDPPPTGEGAADAAQPPVVEDKPARKRSRTKRADAEPETTPVPDTIELTEVSYATALKWGFDRAAVDFQLERFLARARSKGWRYVDWKAAFRTWLLNEVEWARRDGRPVSGAAAPTKSVPRPGSLAARTKSERFGG